MKSLYEQSGGTYHEENGYLIMLNIRKLFDAKELQKIIDLG